MDRGDDAVKEWERTTITGAAPLRTRTMRFDDVPDVLRLVQRAVEHGCRDHYDRGQRDAVYASYARNLFVDALGPFDTVVAEQDEDVVGVAQLDPPDCRLRAIFVDAPAQRHGIGRTLLAEIEARARKRGLTRLHGAMSLNAVPFYLNAGFRPYGGGPEQLVSVNISIPVLRMEKQLRARPSAPPSK